MPVSLLKDVLAMIKGGGCSLSDWDKRYGRALNWIHRQEKISKLTYWGCYSYQGGSSQVQMAAQLARIH